jgi:hypothetical protein
MKNNVPRIAKISSFYKGETLIYGDLTDTYSLVQGASLSSIL